MNCVHGVEKASCHSKLCAPDPASTTLEYSPLEAGILLMCLRDQRRRYEKSIARLKEKFGEDTDTDKLAELVAKWALTTGLIRRIKDGGR